MSQDGYRDAKGRQRPASRGRRDHHRSAQAPSQRRRTADAPRRVAYDVLRAVNADGAYANIVLPRMLRQRRIEGRDAAFASELVYGTLRMQGLYDKIVEWAAGRPVGQIDDAVLDTVRLGAHQLLGMRVKTHAAASETVALAREVNGAGAAGFVNAVLRRVTERTREEWLAEVTGGRQELDALAVEHSHPEWIVRALRGALLSTGTATDDTVGEQLRALLVADNTPADVALVARPGLCTVDELVELGAEKSELSPVGARWPGGDPGSIDAVRDGRAAVQDEGSQLLALALAAVPVDGEGQEWLDLCAGPGGKAALLACLADQQGAVLYANEVSEHRTDLVRRTMRAAVDAGVEVYIGCGDGRDLGREEPETYDRVLVDAPCTGLGALRRRPEARWRRSAGEVPALTSLQGDLLDSALAATRPGGVVAYSTCSPHVAETEQVVVDALRRHPGVELEDARRYFRDAAGEQVADLGDGPTVQLWPHVHGTDAMYFALLRKPSS